MNAKAEAYWSLREWLEPRGLAGLTDEETQANSPASVTGTPLRAGWRSRAKENAKKRGQSSPDRAEALVMAFARVPCALMNWPPIWQDRRQAPQIRRCGRRPTPLWPGRRALGNWLEMASGKQVLPCRPAFRNQPTNVAAALGRIKPKPWIWSGCSEATDICRYRPRNGRCARHCTRSPHIRL